MRRWCQGEWVWRRGWAHPQKKIIFRPQRDKFECILPQFFNKQKTRKPWDTDFTVQSRNYKAYKSSAKIIQKFTVRPGRGAVAPSPCP